MAKYVPDILSRRWVIISSGRAHRPNEEEQKQPQDTCPFCPGNEEMTKGEVYRIGKGEPDTPGWEVRIIPNKFPITDFHEVIIHSPDCKKDFQNLPTNHINKIFTAYRDRFNFYRDKGQVMIFCNHGKEAGASQEHPHSQLVVIPFQINLDTLVKEPLTNIVEENNFFNIYCPDFSQWPYEVWIAPKQDGGMFGDLKDVEIEDLVEIFQKYIVKLEEIYHKKHPDGEFNYNFYIHPKENWYMRIIPRFVHRAGFELGTGLSVNVVDPTAAAMELKGVEAEMVDVMQKLAELKK